MSQNRESVPRNGVTMMVGVVARISGCASQKEVSLEDQVDHIKETFAEMWEGPVQYVITSTKGKGERLDRPELADVEKLLRSATLDFLICEDFGRLVRGGEASWLCGVAVDHGTRVISINDCIDTIDPEWEADVLAACSEHVGHNAHTSKRIKKKLMLRFRRNGGARASLPYGYVLPEGGKTYFDVRKDPDPETDKHLRDGRDLLETTLNYSAVAQMFNARNVPGGPSRRKDVWTGAAIKRLYHNPIHKGTPSRGSRKTEKQHQSGRRVLDRLECLQDFEAQFREMVAQAERTHSVDADLEKVRCDEEKLLREHSNLLDAIAKYGADERFDERIADVRRRQTILQGTRHRLERAALRQLTLPESPQALRSKIVQSFSELSTTSMEFHLLMQQMVPEFHVYNVRLCHGGPLLPRIQARLDLAGIAPDARRVEGLQQLLTSTVTVDVFTPPQHVKIREEAVRLIAEGYKQRDACQLIDLKPKLPTLQKALALQKTMEGLGLISPYVFQQEPPEDYPKLRRYKTPHFRFEPLDGYHPPKLF